MKTHEIRQAFIQFFQEKGHLFIPGSSTIPIGDQTLLFTVAGMTQFKTRFTGEEIRPEKRATNSQKCIRVADLDDVGKDGRHCTFFEMLGSWSFGDYYKKEAIQWAYEFVRDKLELDMKKIWISVYHDDEESFALWRDIGIPVERIVRLGDKDNFWAMGPTGPCGPCSEIYFDQGESVGHCAKKGFPCLAGPGCDCDRYLEFWNLVFMQFNRKEDGTLVDLPMKSVDTGMGLERVAALKQQKTSAFETDVFVSLKQHILRLANIKIDLQRPLSSEEQESCNVVADHVRMLTFTLADGAYFSNEGRGYVLRRVLRRALRHVHRLCPDWPREKSFLAELIPCVIQEMGQFFPEITENKNRIQQAIAAEELRFSQTLEGGLAKFQHFLSEVKAKQEHVLDGEQVFILHDSFGFPFDLTRVLCEEQEIVADLKGFEACMQQQRERSRAESQFYKSEQDESPWIQLNPSDFILDKTFIDNDMFQKNFLAEENTSSFLSIDIPESHVKKVRQLKNALFELIIAKTPFYPEGGGQVADRGQLQIINKKTEVKHVFTLVDVQKSPAGIVHLLKQVHSQNKFGNFLSEDEKAGLHLFENDVSYLAQIDIPFRLQTTRHHTATHLLHKSLQCVLGDHVRQAGSLVNNECLRFDFSHPQAVTPSQLKEIENLVNKKIWQNISVCIHENVRLSEAKLMGALALFDEKYEDFVRVLQIGDFSLELCGGTHVSATGQIGLFKIVSESSVTSGIRRIEAIAGECALEYMREMKSRITSLAEALRCPEPDLVSRAFQLREQVKEQDRFIERLQSRLVNAHAKELAAEALLLGDVRLITAFSDATEVREIELLCDRLKEKPKTVCVIASQIENRAHIIVAVTADVLKLHPKLAAGGLAKELSFILGGKGGGRPDFARGSGTQIEHIPAVFQRIKNIVSQMVGESRKDDK